MKKINSCLNIFAIFVCVMFLFGAFTFHISKNISFKKHNINIYSQGNQSENLKVLIEKVHNTVKKTDFFDPNLESDIYFTKGEIWYGLFSFYAYDSYGLTYPFTNNIYLNKSDIKKNIVYSSKGKRELSSVISHEIIHNFLVNHYGVFKSVSFPTWKVEGYADYVVGSGSFNDEEGKKLLCEKSNNNDPSYKYYTYRQAVTYLIENEGKTAQELFDEDYEFDLLINSFINVNC